MMNSKQWGLFLLSIFTFQLAQAQALSSEDNTTSHYAELRAQATFTKHFNVRNQSIHLYFGEEIFSRPFESTYSQLDASTSNNPQYFRRSYTTVGVSYAPISHLRLGAQYTLKILGNKFTASDGTSNSANEFLRHRATFFVTGSYTYEDWKFSLRERLDANFRTDSVNLHESRRQSSTSATRSKRSTLSPASP